MSNFYGMYIGNNRVLVTPQYGGKLHALADDLSITTGLLLEGHFEIGLTNYILNNIRQGMNVVDIGANIGYFSVLLGYKVGESGRVNSFEPNIKVFGFLLDNLTLNELKRNVTCHPIGIYSERKWLDFNISEKFQGNSSLKDHSDQYKSDFKSDSFSSSKILVKPIDSLDFLGDYIDFIKLDIEGGEYHAFKGMKNRLDNQSIGTIIFELNKSMLQEDTDLLLDFLKGYSNNYKFSLLNSDGSTTIEYDIENIFSRYNFIENIVMKKG